MTVVRSHVPRIRLTTSTNCGSSATPARITSQPTIAIVRWSAWSARNRIPGHGVHAAAEAGRRRLPGALACARRAAACASASARRVAWTFQRSTSMWVTTTTAR